MPDVPMDMPKSTIALLGGTGPFGYVTMGGIFSVLKIREGIATYDDPGDYANPEGTVAGPATEEALRRDGLGTAAEARPEARPAAPSRMDGGHPHHHGGAK
jgi:hypothetical protein